jgi:RNA polymerase-binding transcription factor DksA
MISDLDMDADRIPDVLDRATAEADIRNQECINEVLRRRESPPSDFDGVHCTDCGEEIPKDRLSTGAFRDIHCQNKHELMLKHRRKN